MENASDQTDSLPQDASQSARRTGRIGIFVFGFATLVTLVLVGTTAISFLARRHWLADLCANLRVQQVIGLLVVLCLMAILRKWRWMCVGVCLLLLHLPFLESAWTGIDDPIAGQAGITVTVMNVLTHNPRHDAIIDQAKQSGADVIVVLELGSRLSRKMEVELADDYPHRIASPQDDGNFGIGLYSRLPIRASEQFSLNVRSIQTVSAVIQHEGRDYWVVGTHPLPPMRAKGFRLRNEHLRQLVSWRKSHKNRSMSSILVGDLNLTPWSPLFADFEQSSGLHRAGSGVAPTWYAKLPLFPLGLVLDHGLISDDLQCVSQSVGGPMGSDHRAVTLQIVPRQDHEQLDEP